MISVFSIPDPTTKRGREKIVWFSYFLAIFHYILLNSQDYGLDPKSGSGKLFPDPDPDIKKNMESRIQSRNRDCSFMHLFKIRIPRSWTQIRQNYTGTPVHTGVQKIYNFYFIFCFLFPLSKRRSVHFLRFYTEKKRSLNGDNQVFIII